MGGELSRVACSLRQLRATTLSPLASMPDDYGGSSGGVMGGGGVIIDGRGVETERVWVVVDAQRAGPVKRKQVDVVQKQQARVH